MDGASGEGQVRAWLRGLLPLAALPLSWLLLARFGLAKEWMGQAESVKDMLRFSASLGWRIALGAATLLALAHSGRVLLLSSREGRAPAELALMPLLIPGALAVLATDSTWKDLSRAGTHCGPETLAGCLVRNSGEVLALPIVWLTVVGVAIALVAVAMLFSGRQTDLIARLALSAGVLVIGLSVLVSAKVLASARTALIPTLTRSNEWSRLVPVAHHFSEDGQAATLLLLSGVLIAVGASFRRLRRESGVRAMSAVFVVALLVVGVRAELAYELRLGSQYLAEWLPHGLSPTLEGSELDETSVREGLRKDREFCATIDCDRPAMATLAIDAAVDQRRLEAAFQTVAGEGVRWLALVRGAPEPEKVPSVFEAARLREAARVDSWRLGIRYDDEPGCEPTSGASDYEWWLHPCRELGTIGSRNVAELLTELRAAEERGQVAVLRVPRPATTPPR